MNVQVRYFAVFREEAEKSRETVEFPGGTVEELYSQISRRYGFSLPANELKYAVNDEFRPASSRIEQNDSVAFIPPVAGG